MGTACCAGTGGTWGWCGCGVSLGGSRGVVLWGGCCCGDTGAEVGIGSLERCWEMPAGGCVGLQGTVWAEMPSTTRQPPPCSGVTGSKEQHLLVWVVVAFYSARDGCVLSCSSC